MLWAVTLYESRRRAVRRGADHLHGAGARRLSARVRGRDRGRSLGKMAMGLRVVSDDGGPERFRQALFRALARCIEIWMFAGGPAVICSLVSAKGKRLGDVFAGTMVISERAPQTEPAAADAAGAGVVGGVAAAVRSAARAGRSGAPVPLPCNTIGARDFATRWPTGSAPRWWRRSRHRRRRAHPRRSCSPRCWPSAIAGS